MDSTSEAMERINRRAWAQRDALDWYGRQAEFTDPGERAAFARVVDEARGRPVLDLGVGGGRTTALLAPTGPEYVGVDYTPEMVAISRRRFPALRFEVCDARDLSRFPADHFQLVLFSYNGIDAVGPEGRRQVLAEVFRVLRPGGAFLFSTFNRHGPDFAPRFRWSMPPARKAGALRTAARLARDVAMNAVGYFNLKWNRRHEHRGPDHAVLVHSAHHYGVLVYAGTLAEVRAQLRKAGFAQEAEAFGSDHGGPTDDATAGADRYVHLLARKPQP
jgi:SAM-dependent methyltransferase